MILLVFSLLVSLLFGEEWVDLEAHPHPCILNIKKIEVPGYPLAFNPSIVPFHDNYLMSFRIIPDRKSKYVTYIGVILLDNMFQPIGEAQILENRIPNSLGPNRAEDGRLIWLGNRLFLVYDDNDDVKISKGGFRMFIGEIRYDGSQFSFIPLDKIIQYEGVDPNLREKAWTPFDYEGNLLLSYCLEPHRVFAPILGKGYAKSVTETQSGIEWPWGIIRGGTPALRGIGDQDEYLTFFHSSIRMKSVHSDGKAVLHYFIGAVTFSAEPPFALTRISPEPITVKGFYSGPIYEPYWHPVRVVFPAGFVFDEKHIYLFYGRQDHEIWMATIDRKELMKSLVPVETVLFQRPPCPPP